MIRSPLRNDAVGLMLFDLRGRAALAGGQAEPRATLATDQRRTAEPPLAGITVEDMYRPEINASSASAQERAKAFPRLARLAREAMERC